MCYTSFYCDCDCVDDIPVRGFVGRLEETGIFPHKHSIYLWTHLTFNIEYNGDEVPVVLTYFLYLLVHLCLFLG